MDRRRALAAGAGAVLTGAGLWAALGGGAGGGAGGSGGAAGGLPVTVDVVETEGGSDTVRLPSRDAVTVVDLFATWCPTCPEQLEEVAAVHEAHRDDEEVVIVSVTNERFGAEFTRDDLLAWWDEHGGPWRLAHDPESTTMAAIQAPGLPYLAVVEPSGRVVYGESGTADAGAIEDAIASATR